MSEILTVGELLDVLATLDGDYGHYELMMVTSTGSAEWVRSVKVDKGANTVDLHGGV